MAAFSAKILLSNTPSSNSSFPTPNSSNHRNPPPRFLSFNRQMQPRVSGFASFRHDSSHGFVSQRLISDFRSVSEPIDCVKILHSKTSPSNSSFSSSNSSKHRNPRFLSFNRQMQHIVSNCASLRPDSSRGFVSLRLERLISEFRSVSEPIDRVKKLLDYAAVLPRLGDSTRSPENRVAGCAAQVWLQAEIDEDRRMRFGADSDSEITKGFASCLIYLLDGASADEILKVKPEDFADMNVGISVRSRVSSWHNLLIGMQEKTKSLMLKRDGVSPLDGQRRYVTLLCL